MTSIRRRSLALGAVAAAASPWPGLAQTADWPSRSIRMIVPCAPGGTSDTMARLIGQLIAPALGQSVVVENRAGAGSILGTEAVIRSAPDGYTLLLADTPLTIVPVVQAAGGRPAPFDPVRDLTPVVTLGVAPGVLFAPANLPVRTTADLVAMARARPEGVAIASSGTGTTTHLMAELLQSLAGARMTHVPYRGAGPAVQDVASGAVQGTFVAYASGAALQQSGQIRAIGVASEARLPNLPEVPTLKEQGIDLVAGFWWGIMGPAGLPDRIVSRLVSVVSEAMQSEELTPRLAAMGVQRQVLGQAEFGALVRAESTRWTAVVRAANIRPE